jgi:hypothetical protein
MALARIGLGLGVMLASAAAPAHAVTLGGTNVPKEKFVVYLMIGHSNMAGIDLAHSDGTVNPKDWSWPIASKQWIPAKETPNAGRAAGLSGHGEGGPGMPFLKGMTAAYPDYWFGAINNASLSATCRGENTGNNSSGLDPTDNRYYKGTYLYQQILDAAKAVQAEVTLGGILCMLGTVDATRTNETVCRAFSDDISQLVKDLRSDLGLPNLPFIMGGYEAGATGDFALTKPLPAIVDAQIKLIPSKLPYAAVVDSKGIQMLDDHHYTANVGQPEWAKRAVAIIQANKWLPGSAASIALAPRKAERAGARLGFAAGTLWIGTDDGIWAADGRAPAAGAAWSGGKASWTPIRER